MPDEIENKTEETNEIDNARWNKEEYLPFRFDNGDTKKQLLARSRYLLFKSAEKWKIIIRLPMVRKNLWKK